MFPPPRKSMPRSSSSPSENQPELPLFDSLEEIAPQSLEPTESSSPKTDHRSLGLTRRFSNWDRPILHSITEFLLSSSLETDRVFDVSSLLIVVPTRHAGRRLRENLALEAAKENAAVFPPLVVTQDFFTASERVADGDPVADPETTRLIWSALLLEIDLEEFRCLFPIDPIQRDLTWAMRTADEILEVRNLLTESGLTLATASDLLRDRDMEPLRWKELAALESLAIRRTHSLGRRDDTLSRLDASQSGEIPAEIQQILVAATPDLRPLTAEALTFHATRLPVEILVHAPESEAERFDTWGRPLPEHWLEAEIKIPNAKDTIRDVATPTNQAEVACDLLHQKQPTHQDPKPDDQSPGVSAFAAIGVPDPEVIAPLEQTATRRRWRTYDPAGQPVSRHGIYYLLDETARLLATRSFDAVSALLRCPDFTKALVRHLPEPSEQPLSATAFLALIDKLRERSLPDQLSDALAAAKRSFGHQPEIEQGLQWIEEWMQRFRKESFGMVLSEYLSTVFADRTFNPLESAHGAFSEVAAAILDAESAFESTRSVFKKKLPPSDRFHLLLELIRQRRLYDEREPDHLDLEGWLELLWEDAPYLVVTGMNDHAVPESIVGHAFLPDSARRALGVPDNDDRFARDAYLLTSLIETRRNRGHQSAGRLDLIFGRQSESGDPLRPSRLLFQCSDEELPDRTLQFFGGDAPASQPLPWTLPWKLKPQALADDAKIFQRLSVTQFRSYLTCPFRFYLQHGLRMEEVDPEKSEMDARDFGNLVHDALERFARDPEASISTDVKVIRESLESEIDALLYLRYGSQLSTPVLIQREAARRRLAWWSEIEAAERAAGWNILEPETSISTEDHPFELAGMPISGRIDRIEEHEDGRLRVFDFKTHATYDSATRKNKTVSQYHIAPIKRTEDPDHFPTWSLLETEDRRASRWVDLQIPLYLLALTERFPGREIEAGHIALGPTEAEVVLDLWEGLGSQLLKSAKTCAEGVINSVRERRFWPPAARLPWTDPYSELLYGEAEEAVNPRTLQG